MALQALNPKNAHVLVVEDSPSDMDLETRALHNFGIRHVTASRTAEDGLSEAQRRPYDVAIVDYNLPGMNGLQFMKYMQTFSPDTRVIVVTGACRESLAVAAMKLGATDYVSKDEFLTSGITRSLQAALRKQVAEVESGQRELLSPANRELRESTTEATWLQQALDQRHGYMAGVRGPREVLSEEWVDAVQLFTDYLRASYRSFPDPATDAENALLRIFLERGLSPHDVFRLYAAALRQMMESDGEINAPIRPLLLVSHLLACLGEELQLMLALQEWKS